MEFLGMIGVGVLGLYACGRIFGLVFRLIGKGFDALGDTMGVSRHRDD